MQSRSPLPRSTPESQGVDSAAISRLVAALNDAEALELHSVMVLRHGEVIAEGWWDPYDQDQIHLLYSLSKSFTSAAAGMAAAEGLLSLDDRIVDLFPDHAQYAADDRVRSLTLRHLLRMATGHREDVLPRALAHHRDDLVRGFLAIAPDEEPGSIFCYNNLATYMVGAAVQKRSGQTLTEFLTPRLFEPLGIDRFFWQTDHVGYNIGFSGLHLTTESIARFGQLIIQGGRWNGRQLLDPQWLADATSPQTDTSANDTPDWQQGYGYQFWMSQHGFRGDGAYGQFCLVLPEQDLVVAITEASADIQQTLTLIWQHLLPACADAPLPENAAALAELQDRLQALTLTAVDSPDWTPSPLPEPSGPEAPLPPLRVTQVERADQLVRVTVDHDELKPGRRPPQLTFEIGLSSWHPGMINFEGAVPGRVHHDTSLNQGSELPYAASGAWREDGSFVGEIAFVQTPHRLRVTARQDGTTEIGWITLPLVPPYPEGLATRPQKVSST